MELFLLGSSQSSRKLTLPCSCKVSDFFFCLFQFFKFFSFSYEGKPPLRPMPTILRSPTSLLEEDKSLSLIGVMSGFKSRRPRFNTKSWINFHSSTTGSGFFRYPNSEKWEVGWAMRLSKVFKDRLPFRIVTYNLLNKQWFLKKLKAKFRMICHFLE